MAYWLMKSEPDVYGIDDLAAEPNQTDHWDGIRNYQVRNMFRDQFKVGDQAFFLSLQHQSARHCGGDGSGGHRVSRPYRV